MFCIPHYWTMKNIAFIALIFTLLPLNTFAADPSADLMEKGLKAHEGLVDFIIAHPCEMGASASCERPLSGKDLDTLKQHLQLLEEWRKLAFDGIVPMANTGVEFQNKIEIGDEFKITSNMVFNPRTLKEEKVLHITLNPLDQRSQDFVKQARRGVATTLLLYDSYFRLAKVLEKATKLRNILQYDLPGEAQILTQTYSLASDEELWNKTTHAVSFLMKEQKLRGVTPLDAEEKYFEQFIMNSFIGERMMKDDFNFRARTALFLSRQVSQSQFYENINRLVGLLSQIFGNSAGTVQTRDGKLKHLAQDPASMNALKSKLRPLDILLEKTPMRLTDKFIPGFYGHVAIWLGTPQELDKYHVQYLGKSIPLLDHPDVLPHLEKFSQGQLIVEALRLPGVTVNTLEHFMDIDDLVVLEAPPMSEDKKAEHLLKAIQQIGKAYDFNFDVETDREIVCSELAYVVYTDITWPTSVSMGRFTINPDQVAWKAVDSCFNPVLMYHDGKQVKVNMKQELRRLLELPGGISYTPQGTCFEFHSFSRTDHPPQGE